MPTRNEFIVRCHLTKTQLEIYKNYLEDTLKLLGPKKHLTDKSLPMAYMIVQNLRKICNHPYIFFNYHANSETLGEKTNAHKMLAGN